MARLEWNRPADRFFENGIDQGVLFVEGNIGVPWSGLVGFTNKSRAGEVRDVYIDGVKVNSERATEEYLGTLEALYYPVEFEQCDGTGYDADALVRVGLQPRKPFHLAYRSWSGSARNGLQDEYKIHLIYNAYVMPSSRKFQTISNSVELSTFQWDIMSTPVQLPGYLPTSHIIFDSRNSYPEIMLAMDNIIFGSYLTDSRMPMPEELVTMITEYYPGLIIPNYVTGLHHTELLGVRDPRLTGDVLRFREGYYRRSTSSRLMETRGTGLYTLEN